MLFFFKQKTAYEMRISDWSSDVCSSDLAEILPRNSDADVQSWSALQDFSRRCANCSSALRPADSSSRVNCARIAASSASRRCSSSLTRARSACTSAAGDDASAPASAAVSVATGRSEEHTSELQSLMRISYAVFCLKKKKKTMKQQTRLKKTDRKNNMTR